MATNTFETDFRWTGTLIRRLRAGRTQSEFGELIGVRKNTVWRWEAGHAAPSRQHAELLSQLAARQHFLKDWKLLGSMELVSSIAAGSRDIREGLEKSISRSTRELG